MVYVLPVLSDLAGSKSVSAYATAHPPVRPGYDNNYHSRVCIFVERQKPTLKFPGADFRGGGIRISGESPSYISRTNTAEDPTCSIYLEHVEM